MQCEFGESPSAQSPRSSIKPFLYFQIPAGQDEDTCLSPPAASKTAIKAEPN